MTTNPSPLPCAGCGELAPVRRTYCSDRCRERVKKRRARARARDAQPPPVVSRASTLGMASSEYLALAAAGAAEAVRKHRRTSRDLARALETIAGLSAQLADARASADVAGETARGIHADATALAHQVAVTFRAAKWAGYDGPLREVVERYVRTGH